jgi:hypothetical protein
LINLLGMGIIDGSAEKAVDIDNSYITERREGVSFLPQGAGGMGRGG